MDRNLITGGMSNKEYADFVAKEAVLKAKGLKPYGVVGSPLHRVFPKIVLPQKYQAELDVARVGSSLFELSQFISEAEGFTGAR